MPLSREATARISQMSVKANALISCVASAPSHEGVARMNSAELCTQRSIFQAKGWRHPYPCPQLPRQTRVPQNYIGITIGLQVVVYRAPRFRPIAV